jgi:hypothetical protein
MQTHLDDWKVKLVLGIFVWFEIHKIHIGNIQPLLKTELLA